MAAIASPRVSRLRRYPALAFLLAAAVLASLLPSSLRVPLSGPSASAELAPVPGKSDASTGDLSALGETSTGGLGSGAGAGGSGYGGRGGRAPGATAEDARTGSDSGSPGSGRNLRNKRCVGNPPRQTEDPLSPPCVAFFDGDNGGATAKGVTGDEIRLAIQTGGCTAVGQRVEIDADGQDKWAVLLRFFNGRYQTYGRRVRAWRISPPPCRNATESRANVHWWDDAVDAFALIGFGDEAESDEAAKLGVWADLEGGKGSLMGRRAPYIRSFVPDTESRADHVVEFVCRNLAGRPARYHGEPTDRQKTRKFAITSRYSRESDFEERDRIVEGVRQRCGDRAGRIETASADNLPTASGQWASAWANDIARWRTGGVTTILNLLGQWSVYAMPVVNGASWYPEWFMPWTFDTLNGRSRTFPAAQMAQAFGIQFDPRVPERQEQSYRYNAYREACPDGSCGVPTDLEYYRVLLLFRGIQAAGPRLTVANVDRGLRAITPHPSPDPFLPAAYFAPGSWSFVKDAAVVRWDPTGVPPGGQPGCWRYVEHGRRYRAEDWKDHPGDGSFDTPGWPCRGEG